MIKSGSLFSFMASILVFFALVTEGTLCKVHVLVSIALVVVSLSSTCVSAAMLPFLTDQLIGATADQLSTVVYWYWYYWAVNFGHASSDTIFVFGYLPDNVIINIDVYLSCIVAVPLALNIISDCLCLQWLDRTHKFNPIKLIVQVLNYIH